MTEHKEHVTNKTTSTEGVLTMPMAVLLAGALIAGAVVWSGSDGRNAAPTDTTAEASLDEMRPITKDDHIRGDINAPIKIVEYSDTECPFCKRFHSTMRQVIDEYGASGKVAWVYRHLPLDQLHSKARKESVAIECAGDQGGNDAFWAYTDRLYEITPANNGLDLAELPKIAAFVGLDVAKFNTCLASGKFDKRIEDDAQNAYATGGNGTPWSIVVSKNGKKYPLNGALPYESVKQLIELALQDK